MCHGRVSCLILAACLYKKRKKDHGVGSKKDHGVGSNDHFSVKYLVVYTNFYNFAKILKYEEEYCFFVCMSNIPADGTCLSGVDHGVGSPDHFLG